ncbi:MAG: lipoyl(octanoyl) transferase LipB [Bacteroidales bacterium]|nr:lipoyl(octanoyl) transferase LipB [Bacteroidales bacterium]
MIIYDDWGRMEYALAWQKQKELFDARIIAKNGINDLNDIAVFCEHPHVFTLGKSGVEENLLVNNQTLKDKGVAFFKTDRGGDITYHGPGQIVVYPILDLEHFNIGLRQYIYYIEEAVILFLLEFGVKGERFKGATGVWIDTDVPVKTRKICAIGVKSSRFVTMHGLALNINTDLSYYSLINPCGFTDKGVTSLEKETDKQQDLEYCRKLLFKKILQVFNH